MTITKAHQNSQGETLYIFNWEGGGGNRVYARDLAEATQRAQSMGDPILKVQEGSVRASTWEEYLEFDRDLFMMTF